MRLIIKPSSGTGARERTFSHVYGGIRYTIGPEPVNVPTDAGEYLLKQFSSMVELVPPEPRAKRKR